MNFDHLPVITRGAHAGMPRPICDQMLDQHSNVKRVILGLKRDGFDVISVSEHVALQPVVQVLSGRLTEKMIADDRAAYYLYRHNERHGQFVIDGVRVIWVEHKKAVRP